MENSNDKMRQVGEIPRINSTVTEGVVKEKGVTWDLRMSAIVVIRRWCQDMRIWMITSIQSGN